MKSCPHCGALITPGASDCTKCGAVFDGSNAVLPGGASETEVALSNARLAAYIFTFLVVFWPFASLASLFMFDAPGAGGFLVWLLFWSTVLYGPVYFVALFLSRARKLEGDSAGSLKAWLYLCGTNVAIWNISFFLVMGLCSGKFSCR
ncbi:MAG: zinc ribbon domain-containing protein [Rhodocyclaceae bacterium]|jgi:hypothetical protein|nr:zinc ribbon domain-containing protein [Rhodocyclaceae bacterium]